MKSRAFLFVVLVIGLVFIACENPSLATDPDDSEESLFQDVVCRYEVDRIVGRVEKCPRDPTTGELYVTPVEGIKITGNVRTGLPYSTYTFEVIYENLVVVDDGTNPTLLNGSYNGVLEGDTLTMDGKLTLSGGISHVVDFDVEVILNANPDTFSGRVVIDGKAFDASAFVLESSPE